MLENGLPLIAAPDARIFILGSLPGARSLAAQRYYAHPTNQFWKLVGQALGIDLATLDYAARLAALVEYRIGLWDVIDAARRDGSADHRIRDARANNIGGLRDDFPDLRAIAFNGLRAAKDGRRLLPDFEGIDLLDLPSSSAAHTLPLAGKARRWAVVADYASKR
jgi:hypoxanthine-DNA glycosylase